MSTPPNPPSLDHLATRPFSFYPPIVNIEHNEWLFRKATWSEILVVNCKTGKDIWISRRYIGEVSRSGRPGAHRRPQQGTRVQGRHGVALPAARHRDAHGGRRVRRSPLDAEPPATPPRSMVGMRVESGTDIRIFKLIGAVVAVGIVLYLLSLNLDARRRAAAARQVHHQGPELSRTEQPRRLLSPSCRSSASRRRTAGSRRPARSAVSGALVSGARLYRHPDGQRPQERRLHRRRSTTTGTRCTRWSCASGGSTFSMLRGLKRF